MSEVIFAGPDGRLEGRYHKSEKEGAPIALVLHSEPELGGNMNDKVTYTIFQSFVSLGFSVLRFNFHSVGNPAAASQKDDGSMELAAATAALDWLQMENKDAKICWVGGFSFGAWIGMQLLMRRPEINGFVSVAVPAATRDFSFLAPCPTSGLILQGANDDRTPENMVQMLSEKLKQQRNISVEYKTIASADHNFTGHLKDVYKTIIEYVTEGLKHKPRKVGKKSSRSVKEAKGTV
jgi:alpha/beta superfamily hydrolase